MGTSDGSTGRPCVKCGALPAFYIWVTYTDDLPLCAECGTKVVEESAPAADVATGTEAVGDGSG